MVMFHLRVVTTFASSFSTKSPTIHSAVAPFLIPHSSQVMSLLPPSRVFSYHQVKRRPCKRASKPSFVIATWWRTLVVTSLLILFNRLTLIRWDERWVGKRGMGVIYKRCEREIARNVRLTRNLMEEALEVHIGSPIDRHQKRDFSWKGWRFLGLPEILEDPLRSLLTDLEIKFRVLKSQIQAIKKM